MKIAIAGASGFVGTSLSKAFLDKGYEVVQLQRDTIKDLKALTKVVEQCDTIINLSGANILHRWNDAYKNLLYSSRIGTTRNLVKAMERATSKPKIFISTSAVGIYNNKNEHSEEDFEYSEDFLGNLCQEWEAEASQAAAYGIRTVIFRFGIVLGKKGGALQKMLLPFKLGVGGIIGNGQQAFSFIHIDDLINGYIYAIEHKKLEGTYNMTAPQPTTNKELTKTLGEVLKRPTIIPLPSFILNLLFGEGAKVLTDGQSAVPKKLLQSGFTFEFKTIQDALQNLLK